MESILVAFLRQLGVQDELRISLDSEFSFLFFFCGSRPTKNITTWSEVFKYNIEPEPGGEEEISLENGFRHQRYSRVSNAPKPPSPHRRYLGEWPQIHRTFTSNGQWVESSKRFNAYIKLSPREGADLWLNAYSFWVLFFVLTIQPPKAKIIA